jgi:hypothetical protein
MTLTLAVKQIRFLRPDVAVVHVSRSAQRSRRGVTRRNTHPRTDEG